MKTPNPVAQERPTRPTDRSPEVPRGLLVAEAPSGESLHARVWLDPGAGRVRIDWAVRPGLWVRLQADGQVLFCEGGGGGRYDAIWQPGEYECRLEALRRDPGGGTAERLSFRLTVPDRAGSLRRSGVTARRQSGKGATHTGGAIKVEVRRKTD